MQGNRRISVAVVLVHLLDMPHEDFELSCRLSVVVNEEISDGRFCGSSSVEGLIPRPLLDESAARRRNCGVVRLSKCINGVAEERCGEVTAEMQYRHRSDDVRSMISLLEHLQRRGYREDTMQSDAGAVRAMLELTSMNFLTKGRGSTRVSIAQVSTTSARNSSGMTQSGAGAS